MAIRTSGGDRVSVFNYCSIYTSGSSSIRDSYNTSSITEHSGENYQVTFDDRELLSKDKLNFFNL